MTDAKRVEWLTNRVDALEAALRDYAPCDTCDNKGNVCDYCDDLHDKWKFDEWQWRRKEK